MIGLLIVGIILLFAVVVVQIGRVSDLTSKIRGEEATKQKITNSQAVWVC